MRWKRLPAAREVARRSGSIGAPGGRIHVSQISPPAQKVISSSASQVEIAWKSEGPSKPLLDEPTPAAPGKWPVGSTGGTGGTEPSGRAMRKMKEPPVTCPSSADWARHATT